jgi:hypothetical protein
MGQSIGLADQAEPGSQRGIGDPPELDLHPEEIDRFGGDLIEPLDHPFLLIGELSRHPYNVDRAVIFGMGEDLTQVGRIRRPRGAFEDHPALCLCIPAEEVGPMRV